MRSKNTTLSNKLSKSLAWLHFCAAVLVFVLGCLFAAVHSQLGLEISAGESPGFAFIGDNLSVLMGLALAYLIAVGGLQVVWIRSKANVSTSGLKILACIQFVCMGIVAPAVFEGWSPLASMAAVFLLASILLQGYTVLCDHLFRRGGMPGRLPVGESHAVLFLVLLFFVNAGVAQLDPSWQRLKDFIHLNSGIEIVLHKTVPAVFAGITGIWFGVATLAIIALSAFFQKRLNSRSFLMKIFFFLPFVVLCSFYTIITLSALMVAIEWQVDQLGLRPAFFALAILAAAIGGALLSKAHLRVLNYRPQSQTRSPVGLVCVALGAVFIYPLFWLMTAKPYRRAVWIMLLVLILLLCGLVNYLLLYGDLFNPWFTAFSYLKAILLKISTIITAGALVLLYEEVAPSAEIALSGSGYRWALLIFVALVGFLPFGMLNAYPKAKAALLQFSDLARVEAAFAREIAGLFKVGHWVRLGQNPGDNQHPHPWPQPWKLQKVKPSLLPDDFNLMIIVVDALRGDAFHSAGYHRNLTPFLDKWAQEEAISFRRAYSQGGGSFAAFPFLVAGRSRFTLYGPDLYRENLYLKIAQAEGIRHFMVMQGFGPRSIFPPDEAVLELTIPRAVSDRRTATAEEVFDSARKAITRIGPQQRFLCFLHLMDVHNDLWKKPGGVDFGSAPKDLYDSNLAYLDGAFERFVAWLKSSQIYEKTVILFTSDHGEQFWEHGASLHGHTVYEEEIRIPLILLAHGSQRRFENVPVISADMAPTIAELAGYAIDPPYNDPHMGLSLVPLLFDVDHARYLRRDIVGRASFKRRYFLLRDWQWKFIYFAELDLLQLFNVADDPLEKNNLIEEKPRLAAELEHELLSYLTMVEGKTYRPLLSRHWPIEDHYARADSP